ncbi:ATP-binding protein [Candidatus Laterigemmans baculatus]|uniref:ATP-binding protein n=1 Tax=Candidatus Laterigemmans baculatus TaxID=2770505 RepID=UPI001F171C88|nr:ferredoxin family protein [Candidatus Laterigemmans baculatus]
MVSRGQSRAPEKRALEAALVEVAEKLADRQAVRVLSIPHLYDLPPGGETVARLREISGDIVFLSWVYPRAARWVLDRAGIRGQFGRVELVEGDGEGDEEAAAGENPLAAAALADDASTDETPERVLDTLSLPDRKIYCIDLRVAEDAAAYADELRRILSEGGEGTLEAFTESGGSELRFSAADDLAPPDVIEPLRIEEGTTRRWYPVIDFSRCTNCMECIDFCLFGVYGINDAETILVEQPDNCRKGCPACSRVCPENAIIFPQHKTPAIAGAETDDGTGLKIDLSLLFGAPEKDEDPIAAAARERDEQLLLAGRAAVGMEVGIPKRRLEKRTGPKDDLDQLIDQLDGFDL